MRLFLNLPPSEERWYTLHERGKHTDDGLGLCSHRQTHRRRGVMHHEMKYSAGFWWRLLNQSECCHSNLKTCVYCRSIGLSTRVPFLSSLCVFGAVYICVCVGHLSRRNWVSWEKDWKRKSSMFQEVPLPRLVSSFIQKSWGLWRRWDVKRKGAGKVSRVQKAQLLICRRRRRRSKEETREANGKGRDPEF